MPARSSSKRLLGPALRTQPDNRLAALAREGSEAALDEVVRRYRAALVRYAGSIVGAAAAEDVVQDSLAKALTALARADEEVRLRPWLYAIVRNTGLNHLRDAGPATEPIDESYDGVEQPPQALERREGLRALVGGLRRLPRQQREALVKRELEGRSHEEIAADLGVSGGAARQLIFRARESLRVGFGSLLPMPLLRWLAEGGGDGAAGAAAGAGGAAVATKAALAILATGAAVTAGVAIQHGGGGRAHDQTRGSRVEAAAVRARASAAIPVDDSGVAVAPSGSGETGHQAGDDGHRGGGKGRGEGKNGGGGEVREGTRAEGAADVDSSGPGPGSGPGSGDDHGGNSGHSGSGDDHGGSSHHSGSSDGSGGSEGSGHSAGGPGGASHSGSNSGSGSRGGSDSGSGSGQGSGGSSSGGSGPGDGSEVSATAPTGSSGGDSSPSPPSLASGSTDSGSGSSTGGGPSGSSATSDELSESSRDLSGAVVSQGTDDPD